MMKMFERLDNAMDRGISKDVFDHLRNFLICAFLLAIGTNEIREHTSILFGFIPGQYAGSGVIVVALFLILLNLYDGISKISKTRCHSIFTVDVKFY